MSGSNSFTGDLLVYQNNGSTNLLNINAVTNRLEFGSNSTNRLVDFNESANSIRLGVAVATPSFTSVVIPGSLTVNNNLTVNGTLTYVNTNNLEVKDKNILLNKGGTTVGGDGAGIEIEGDGAAVVGAIKLGSITNQWALSVPNGNIFVIDQSLATTANVTFNSVTSTMAPTFPDNSIPRIDLALATANRILYNDINGNIADTSITSNGSDISIPGTLTVIGNTSLSSLSTSSLATLNSLSVTNGGTVNGTLTSVGLLTANNGLNVTSGNLDVFTGNLTVAIGNTSLNTLSTGGLATVNGLLVGLGRVQSDLIPDSTNTRDLGSSGLQWKDLYLTGTATIQNLVVNGITSFVPGSIARAAIQPATANMIAYFNASNVLSDTTISSNGSTLTVPGLLTANSGLNVTGTTTLTGNLLPSSPNIFNIGGVGAEWRDLHVSNVGTFGTVTTGFLNVTSIFTSLVPATTLLNLGSSGSRWTNLYLTGSIETGTIITSGLVTVNSLSVNTTGTIGGLLTANAGLTVAAGNTSLTTLNTSGLATVNGLLVGAGNVQNHLIPSSNGAFDLGDAANTLRWRNIYLTGVMDSGSINTGNITGTGTATLGVLSVTSTGTIGGLLTANAGLTVAAGNLNVTSGNVGIGGTLNAGATTVSSLTVSTNVNSSLIPAPTNNRDLGSSTNTWKDLYLGGKAQIGDSVATDVNGQMKFAAVPLPSAITYPRFQYRQNNTYYIPSVPLSAAIVGATGAINTVAADTISSGGWTCTRDADSPAGTGVLYTFTKPVSEPLGNWPTFMFQVLYGPYVISPALYTPVTKGVELVGVTTTFSVKFYRTDAPAGGVNVDFMVFIYE